MDYYTSRQLVARIDPETEEKRPVEKWEAHTKGILHKGFTVALFYHGNVLLQHRKHPAFDHLFDLTCSSHPIYINSTLQPETDAVYKALKREWNIKESEISHLIKKTHFVYRALDPVSKFIEHEVFSFFTGEISEIPCPNLDFAYGYSLLRPTLLKESQNIFPLLVPWVQEIIRKGIL